MEIISSQILELLPVPHLNARVPNKSLEGDKVFLLEREVRAPEVRVLLHRAEGLEEPEEIRRQGVIEHKLLHERPVNADLCLDRLNDPHSLPPRVLPLQPAGIPPVC